MPASVGIVFSVIAFALAVPLPQVFVGVTCTLPDVVAKETVIALVFVPPVIVAPAGSVQL